MNPKLQHWLRLRTGGSPSLQATWKPVAEFLDALSTVHQDVLLVPLNRYGPTRSFLQVLQKEEDVSAALDLLLQSVDESDESVADWIEAIHEVVRWCRERGKSPGLEEITGYIGCSVSLVGTGVRYENLPATVREMLANYGFEGG